jgi:hypothetical protein
MLLSDRTGKYAEAMIREGTNFDYFGWLRGVQAEEAHAKHGPTVITSGEPVAPETGSRPNRSNCRNGPANVATAVQTKPVPIVPGVYRPIHERRSESPETRLGLRFLKARNSWDDFQESRVRDAVYFYLGAVFEIVDSYKLRRGTQRLLRHALKVADLPLQKNADPFSLVIRCTCDGSADNKTISKWARALRYVARFKKPQMSLKSFIKRKGGINKCAARYARRLGRGPRKGS